MPRVTGLTLFPAVEGTCVPAAVPHSHSTGDPGDETVELGLKVHSEIACN